MILTYQFRVKDSSVAWLNKASKSVNLVWNYCNEISYKAIRYDSRFLSGFDLNKLTSGTSNELGLNSTTVQEIGEEYALKRKQFKKRKLSWRTKKSLGWVPFKGPGIRIHDDVIVYRKNKVKFWKTREIDGKIKCGSFSQDVRGRWYINLVVDVEEKIIAKESSVGIDLGVKTLATLSNGKKYESQKHYGKLERLLILAQKDNKKKRVKNIHAKIKNQRNDNNHKVTNEISKEHNFVVIGDVSSKKLLKTNMAKSISDIGWGQFKTLLEYKVIRRQGVYIEVSEYLTSQVCSVCNQVSDGSPKGLKDLGIREWVCSICGSVHDRDVNSAMNILRLGHQSLALK
jgi:putative transposase